MKHIAALTAHFHDEIEGRRGIDGRQLRDHLASHVSGRKLARQRANCQFRLMTPSLRPRDAHCATHTACLTCVHQAYGCEVGFADGRGMQH